MRILDGGLATTLQRPVDQGGADLAPFTTIHDLLLHQTERVAAVHQAFAAAGAQVVLAGTFRALPHLEPRWEEVARLALDAARSAGVTVAASIGPAGAPGRPWEGDPQPWVSLARASSTVDLMVLETFVTGEELLAAVAAVRSAWSGELVACLTPGPDGRLWSGQDPGPWLLRARALGADAVGFNCGPGCLPASLLHPVDWLKPNLDDGAPAVVLSKLKALGSPLPSSLGGCCGVGPEAIAALVVAAS
jgi:5-methyltetrahydrofolate--homocysteine methyltransferase